jgi:hypothetical protein
MLSTADTNVQAALDTIDNAGYIRQIINATNASYLLCDGEIPFDDTIPQKTEGTEIVTATITPKSTTSTLRIDFSGSGTYDIDTSKGTVALFQDATSNALYAKCVSNDQSYSATLDFVYFMTSGTTSATTFKVRAGTDTSGGGNGIQVNGGGGGTRVYGGVSAARLTITEYGI